MLRAPNWADDYRPWFGSGPAARTGVGQFIDRWLFEKYSLRPGVPVYLASVLPAAYFLAGRLATKKLIRIPMAALATMGSRSLDCFVALSGLQLLTSMAPNDRPEVLQAAIVAASLLILLTVAILRSEKRAVAPGHLMGLA